MGKKINSALGGGSEHNKDNKNNGDNMEDFEKAFSKKQQRKMKKRKAKTVRQRIGMVFIITGLVIVLYFLWLNYYGIVYHEVYSFIYDHFYEGKLDEYSTIFSIDDLPDILTAGGALLPDNGNPALVGISPHTDSDAYEETDAEIVPEEIITSAPETEKEPETSKEPETTERVKELWIMPKVSSKRTEYTGGMYMYVPRLGVWSQIYNGTDKYSLGKGVGMYDISDIPTNDMEADRNLIIAGHRDGARANFYNMHKMKSGDFIYVYMNNLCYTYEYEETKIVESDDWDVTLRRGYSCITLTSCHPIGRNSQRIVVFGKLTKIQEYNPYV